MGGDDSQKLLPCRGISLLSGAQQTSGIEYSMMWLHLFEFGDQQWLPQVLRDAETVYLATSYRFLRSLPRLWAEKISTVLNPGEPGRSWTCARDLAERCH